MNKTVIGVLASGRGSNLQAIVDAIEAGRLAVTIGVVISDNPEANVLKRLAGSDIPAVCIDRRQFACRQDFEAAVAEELNVRHVELVVLAGFMRILGRYFIDRFAGKIMNIHPSLLPAFPGENAQLQALQYGVKVSGCTVHFVDEGMDTGPIILQEAVPVMEDDTEETLSERILHAEHILYPRALALYCEGRLCMEGRRVYIKRIE
ncbi:MULTISPECIES: phosphoribosylglycinamide formyltransferase [Sporomusa]|jgi:phosphoribosylglycinamide formyltransferase-1|uniref:phosphoribosylglycinamide formyltransferase n=1 Tax=Sporomusa TaxID=2375 RepID=UPI00202FEE31|nr:phosphoribosylglycinamide formyltransferase [Sporomusa sphaeroides]MCM0758413.1 phosphoribosylglycinamide formyltransferase [Sporomusa sphaeroides DSM 2875]HML34933.1 phosphoribosylglycinamide formyltransferase [Sporomusa sphaeroides]